MSLLKRYRIKLYVLTDQGIVSGVNFTTNILLVRYFGIDLFGEYSLFMIVVLGLMAINQSMITSPLQSLQIKGNREIYFSQVKGLQLVFLTFKVALGAIVFFGVDIMFPLLITVSFPSLVVYVIGFLVFDFNRKLLYLDQSYWLCLMKDVVSMVLQLVVVLTSGFLFPSLHLSDLLFYLGGSLFMFEGLFFLIHKAISFPKFDLFIRYWVFGRWLLGNAILQWFSGNFYITVGAAVLGSQVAGVIRMGQSVIGIWNVFIQALENYIPPTASRIYQEFGWLHLYRYLVSLTLKGGSVITVIGIIMMFFKSEIWEVLYGIDLVSYSYVLFWFAPILLVNFIGFPIRFAIRTLEKNNFLFESYVLSSIVGFATAKIIIQELGVHGVCFGLLLTQVIMQLWYCYRLYKFIHYGNRSFNFR